MRLTTELIRNMKNWRSHYMGQPIYCPYDAYLTYRLQLVKLQKMPRIRNRRIWWIFVHVISVGRLHTAFDGKFEKNFWFELHDTVSDNVAMTNTQISSTRKNKGIWSSNIWRIKSEGIICTAFLVGCIIIRCIKLSGLPGQWWRTRRKKVYVLDGNGYLYRNPHDDGRNTGRGEAKSHVEMFHHYFYFRTGRQIHPLYDGKAMYPGRWDGDWHNTIPSGKGIFYSIYWVRARCSRYSVTVSPWTKEYGVHQPWSAANRTSE